MPGLCFATTTWLDRLWSEHLRLSEPARELVVEGIKKQGNRFSGFGADLLARLYLPGDLNETGHGPEWASQIHRQASELGEWQQLRIMCSKNGFAAGIASEVVLKQMLPHVPDRQEHPAHAQSRPCEGDEQQHEPGASDQPGGGTESKSEPAPNNGMGQPLAGAVNAASQGLQLSEAELRAAIRKASRAARAAVHDAESAIEGMATPLGLSGSGSGNSIANNSGSANLKAIREAHHRLSGSPRLKRIAKLAGRLERVAATKLRSKIRPGVGQIHGVGLGSDLSSLLPSELVCLRHPCLRLLTLSRVVQNRALVYSMEGREPQGRGPIVVLIDESGSMRDQDKDIWAKAVALALLSTATKQKRAFHLVAFNQMVRYEKAIAAGRATSGDIAKALGRNSRGGTDFTTVVNRAIEIIATSTLMKRADVVILTDGQDALEPPTVERAKRLTSTEGVSWFVVGVGSEANKCVRSLGSIATSIVKIVNTAEDADIIDVVNLEPGGG